MHLVLFDQIYLSDLISGSEHEAGANSLALFSRDMELLPSYIYIHHPSQTPFTIFNSQRSSTTILHNHLETAAMPDQTIKEHFDTIATALDAATAKATGYSKTV